MKIIKLLLGIEHKTVKVDKIKYNISIKNKKVEKI